MIRRLWIAAAAAALLAAVPAQASTTQESIFEDDYQLLQLGSAEQQAGLNDMDRLGADTVRSLVLWNQIAPDPGNVRRPKGFDARNPAAYPAGLWDRYDDLVRGVQARGMQLLFSPTAPMPVWASECKGNANRRRVCRPKAKEFGNFVQALATRYSGTYADENQGGGALPRVDRWSIWNEPNQPGWLEPQYVSSKGRRTAFAAHRYRALARSAIAGLRRAGHGGDQILLAETAPIGRTSGTLARRPIPPVEFIRQMFCLTPGGKRQTGAAAKAVGCTKPGRFSVTGFAHHPYTRGGSQPPLAGVLPGEITISTAGRLKKLLTQAAKAKRIPARLPIFYTEFGYQTNPPDRLFGVSLDEQAEFLNQSDWIAYKDSRVKSVAQYKLVDEPDVASFQTGLRFVDGVEKPGFGAYRLPIWVTRRGTSQVRIYGQTRPAPDNSRELVVVENDETGNFAPVSTVEVTSPKGHFTVDLPARNGKWRLRWAPSDGSPPQLSRVAATARK
jgi:hypothetical protein